MSGVSGVSGLSGELLSWGGCVSEVECGGGVCCVVVLTVSGRECCVLFLAARARFGVGVG